MFLLVIQLPPIPPIGGPQIPYEVVVIARSFFTMIVVIALGIPIIRALTRRFVERPPIVPGLPPEVGARLERIEQAVDAVAIEVERISENQRFTTRLLSEGRGDGARESRHGSSQTPDRS